MTVYIRFFTFLMAYILCIFKIYCNDLNLNNVSKIDLHASAIGAIKTRNPLLLKNIIKQHNFDGNYQDYVGDSLMHYAIAYQQYGLIKQLIQKKVNLNLCNHNYEAPLDIAIACEDCKAIRMLTQSDKSIINSVRVMGSRPLHLAIATNSGIQIIKELIKQGAFINVCMSPSKKRPLHLAIEVGNYSLVEFFCKAPLGIVNVNAQDSEGKTPLHYAVLQQDLKLVNLLLLNSAIDTSIKDSKNRTASYYASMYDDKKIAYTITDYDIKRIKKVNLLNFQNALNIVKRVVSKLGLQEIILVFDNPINEINCVYKIIVPEHLTEKKWKRLLEEAVDDLISEGITDSSIIKLKMHF